MDSGRTCRPDSSATSRMRAWGLGPGFPGLDAAAGELVVVVFQTVYHGDLAVPEDDTPDGGADKGGPPWVVVLGIDFKKGAHGHFSFSAHSERRIA